MMLVEFMRASGEEQLADLLCSLDFDRLAIFQGRLERLLRRYYLVNSGLAMRVYRVDKLALPLKFYRDLSAFKLYLLDVGLLGCAMETEPKDVVLSNKALVEYKGALTEQYVCQQLVAGGVDPYYWTSTNGGAELDFVVRHEGEAAPLEVKAEENLRAKSLRVACDQYHLYGYRTSMSGYRRQDWMTNIPLWAVGEYFRA